MRVLTIIPFLKRKDIDPKQVISSVWEDRERVLDPDVNMFCLERSLHPAIQGYVEEVAATHPDPIVCCVNRRKIQQQIEEVRNFWDSAITNDGMEFWKDVFTLVDDFLRFSEAESGTMHLRVIDNNACAKFHTDGYPLRLFTTYFGKGTEWLPEDAVNRKALGSTNAKIVADQQKVKRLGSGDVAILKGEIPNQPNSTKGIVHRSPAMSRVGEKRIILRVDI